MSLVLTKNVAPYEFREHSEVTEVIAGIGVSSIGHSAFAFCENLRLVDLSAANICAFQFAEFRTCKKLETIIFPAQLKKIGVTTFCRCEALTTISLPQTIEVIGVGAFKRCVNLRAVEFGMRLGVIKNAAFQNCVSLTEIRIPPSVMRIEKYAFRGCVSLRAALIPSHVKIDPGAFAGCDSLCGLNFYEC